MPESEKRVLAVGDCDPDHNRLGRMLDRNFDVVLDRVMSVEEALAKLATERYDLVLVNRLIFADDSDGGELIRRVQTGGYQGTPVMMVSNYADAQAKAVADGAVPGFGKTVLDDSATVELLGKFLKR